MFDQVVADKQRADETVTTHHELCRQCRPRLSPIGLQRVQPCLETAVTLVSVARKEKGTS